MIHRGVVIEDAEGKKAVVVREEVKDIIIREASVRIAITVAADVVGMVIGVVETETVSSSSGGGGGEV